MIGFKTRWRRPFPKFPYVGWVLTDDFTPKEVTFSQGRFGMNSEQHVERYGPLLCNKNYYDVIDIRKTRKGVIAMGEKKIAYLVGKSRVTDEQIARYRENLHRSSEVEGSASVANEPPLDVALG